MTVSAADVDSAGNALVASDQFKVGAGSFDAGLPSGLSLSSPTANGWRMPGSASWTLSGTMNVSPGTCVVRVNVGDGVTSSVVDLTFVVNQPRSTLTVITADSPDPSTSGAGYTVAASVYRTEGPDTERHRDGVGRLVHMPVHAGAGRVELGERGRFVSVGLGLVGLGGRDADLDRHVQRRRQFGTARARRCTTSNPVFASTTTLIASDAPDPSTSNQAYTVTVERGRRRGPVTPTGTVTVRDQVSGGSTCTVRLSETRSRHRRWVVLRWRGHRCEDPPRATYSGDSTFDSSIGQDVAPGEHGRHAADHRLRFARQQGLR